MLVDANLLLYAVHKGTPQHRNAAAWLTEQLNGPKRVGLPWQSLAAFLRISTHPRAFQRPLAPATAWERVTDRARRPRLLKRHRLRALQRAALDRPAQLSAHADRACHAQQLAHDEHHFFALSPDDWRQSCWCQSR